MSDTNFITNPNESLKPAVFLDVYAEATARQYGGGMPNYAYKSGMLFTMLEYVMRELPAEKVEQILAPYKKDLRNDVTRAIFFDEARRERAEGRGFSH